MNDLATDQPAPTPNERPAVWDQVIADMKDRDAVGRRKYGVPLQPGNGRDTLKDMYEELLDAAVYARTLMAEREASGRQTPRDLFADVLAFHEKLAPDQIGTTPCEPTREVRDLRLQLIREEIDETIRAMLAGDLVGIADGLADSIYVLIGTAPAYGIDLGPVWDAVQRANMAKASGPVREDGKRLKPPGWQPPDIASILASQPPLQRQT